MRTSANTKREKAVTAAILAELAAQVKCELEHACVPAKEANALALYATGIERVAQSLFVQAQPRGSRYAG